MSEQERLLITVDDAAQRLSVGKSLMYRLLHDGSVDSVKLGRRRLVIAESLPRAIESMRTSQQ